MDFLIGCKIAADILVHIFGWTRVLISLGDIPWRGTARPKGMDLFIDNAQQLSKGVAQEPSFFIILISWRNALLCVWWAAKVFPFAGQ